MVFGDQSSPDSLPSSCQEAHHLIPPYTYLLAFLLKRRWSKSSSHLNGLPISAGPQPPSHGPVSPWNTCLIWLGDDEQTPLPFVTSSATCAHACSLACPVMTLAFMYFVYILHISELTFPWMQVTRYSPNCGHLYYLTFWYSSFWYVFSWSKSSETHCFLPSTSFAYNLECSGNREVSCLPQRRNIAIKKNGSCELQLLIQCVLRLPLAPVTLFVKILFP